MAESGGAPHQLSRRGELETFCDGFFCFLHLASYRRNYPNAMGAIGQNLRGKSEGILLMVMTAKEYTAMFFWAQTWDENYFRTLLRFPYQKGMLLHRNSRNGSDW
jgi:hypothetical protein